MTTQTAPRVSLCAILGNEAPVIDRWLDSFRPLMDELCVVRAIGNQKPDDTAEKVAAFCLANGIPLRFAEYKNAPGNDWPHIDNFGAARQMAWALATMPWQTWADADDILADGSAEAIRAELALDRGDYYECTYDVRNMGRLVPRERIMRTGVTAWRHHLHENLYPVEGTRQLRVGRIEGAVWIHAPSVAKDTSRDRNLRISSSIDDRHHEWYFRAWDQQLSGDYAEARRGFSAALILERCPLKRYSALLHLSELEPTEETRQKCLEEATHIDPLRREAWGLLAERLLSAGLQTPAADRRKRTLERAMALAHTCAALPATDRSWSTLTEWMTYRQAELVRRTWRALGMMAQADEADAKQFTQQGGVVSLLHATRGRPQQAEATRRRWVSSAQQPLRLEHIFAIDEDDAESIALLSQYRHIIIPKGTDAGGCVAAWNAAAKVCAGRVLVQLSDDWEPFPHWDAAIFGALGGAGGLDKPAVLGVSDGHRTDRLLCMAILTRARYEQQGHLFAPEYSGVFSDDEFTFRAYRDQVVIEARDLPLRHHHPIFAGKPASEWDATHRAQNAPARYREGRKVFIRRNPDAEPPPAYDGPLALTVPPLP
jgi:hypothetical protein